MLAAFDNLKETIDKSDSKALKSNFNSKQLEMFDDKSEGNLQIYKMFFLEYFLFLQFNNFVDTR